MKKIPIRHIKSSFQEPTPTGKIKIRRIEDIVGDTNLVHDLHRHDFFFILAVQKGKGNHEIDFNGYKVSDHSVFILRPGQVHQLELNAGCTGYLLEFDAEFYTPASKSLKRTLRKASNRNYCKPDLNRFNKLQASLTLMFDEYTAKEDGYLDVIKSSLDIFFAEFVRQSLNPKNDAKVANSYNQERFEEFLELLEKHITVYKQASEYTNLMNLSPYQLNEITKSSIGKTASELINEYVILEAKRYLLSTSNQVKEIADHLGYEDTSYFIRFFRKHMGHSPEAFRKNFR